MFFSTKRGLLLVGGGLVVSAAGIYIYRKNSKKSEDVEVELFSQAQPLKEQSGQVTVIAHASEKENKLTEGKIKELGTPEESAKTQTSDCEFDELLDTVLNDVMKDIELPSQRNENTNVGATLIDSQTAKGSRIDSSLQAMESVHFPKYGLQFKIPKGWVALEGPTNAPNAVVIQIVPPEADGRESDASLTSPITIAIEDLGHPNLPKEEIFQLLKASAMETLFFMTNGVQPTLQKDKSISVGPFSYMFEIMVTNLFVMISSTYFIAVENGMAYALQILGKPNSPQLEVLEKVAETVILEPIASDMGHLEVVLKEISLRVSPLWSLKENSSSSWGNALAIFEVTSKMISENAILYRLGDEPEEFQMLESKQCIDDAQMTCSKQMDKKRFVFNNFAMCVTAANGLSRIPESSVIDALKSIETFENGYGENSVEFVKDSHYRFKMRLGGAILESKLSLDTVVYYPKGLQSGPEEDPLSVPNVIIRIDLDQECGTLEEWRAKSEESSPESTFHEEKVCGQQCLIAELKSMVETGINEKTEVFCRSLIFVVGSTSYLVRWELATGAWRRYEQEFERFIAGFHFMQ